MPDVAMTLNNLASLHSDTNRYDKAQKEYSEVLEIFRKLAKENPDAYMPSVATTLNNLERHQPLRRGRKRIRRGTKNSLGAGREESRCLYALCRRHAEQPCKPAL